MRKFHGRDDRRGSLDCGEERFGFLERRTLHYEMSADFYFDKDNYLDTEDQICTCFSQG